MSTANTGFVHETNPHHLFLLLLSLAAVLADHGPGTSGSGFTTLTAETLKLGHFSSSLQFDWTQFDSPRTDLEGVEYIDSS